MADVAFAPALEQARLVRERAVSSRELTELYLGRIDEHDGELNAFVDVMAEEALAAADERDRATAAGTAELGPFHGVPIAVKEFEFVQGRRTTFATSALADFVAPFDDEVVSRLRRSGAVIVGKTNVPELGTLPVSESAMFGPARNPWALERTPGGSSGGAAAALAAGLCAAAQGSDGAGSLRIPASCCGVFTLKPSRHRVSNAPLLVSDVGPEVSVRGMLTRTVADNAAFLDVLAGYVPGDAGMLPPPPAPFAELARRPPGRLRVGVCTTNALGHLAPEVRAAVDAARRLVEDAGHDTVAVDVAVPEDAVGAFGQLWSAMVSLQPVPRDTLEAFNRWLVQRGADVSAAAYLNAEWRMRLFSRDLIARFHGEFDVLLAPVLARLPVPVGHYRDREPEDVWSDLETYLASITPIVNVAGLPAAGLPLHRDADTGLPVGVQVVGRLGAEATLLQLSAQLEEAAPWADLRPPGWS